MKKFVVFLIVVLLAGCQMDGDVEESDQALTTNNESANVTTDVAGESSGQTDRAKETNQSNPTTLNQSLSDALIQSVYELGIMNDAAILFNDVDVTGVLYAELIDLDADGQEELYVLSKTVAEKKEWLQDDDTIFDNFYMHEIWRAGADGATKVFAKQMDATYSFCESCGYSVGFLKQTDGTWLLNFSWDEFFDDDGARFTSEVYRLVSSEMQQSTYVTELTEAGDSQVVLDGEPIDEEAYSAIYSGESIPIIQNTIGQMNFAFDGAEYKFDETDSSAAVVSKVFAQLNDGMNTLAQTEQPIDARKLDAYLETLDDIQLVDIHDKQIHTDMLHNLLTSRIYLMTDSDVQNDPTAEEYHYLPFSEALVYEQFKKLYGAPFEGEIGLLEPSYENSSYSTYADGTFYVRVSEHAFPATVHNIDAAYEISPNTYYIESTMRDFDWLAYSEIDTYHQSFEEDHFRIFSEDAPETWPFDIRNSSHTGLKRYTVFRVDGEELVLKYYHYVPLSDGELEKYK
ncbi:MAG: hypothetical protein ABS951_09950 [Solibacillus sp.]